MFSLIDYDNFGNRQNLAGFFDAVLFWADPNDPCDPACNGNTFFFSVSNK